MGACVCRSIQVDVNEHNKDKSTYQHTLWLMPGLKATNNRNTEIYFLLQLLENSRSMSVVDLLFLKNRENVTQISNIYCYRVNILTQIFASGGGGPWNNILSNVGWRPNTCNSLGRRREILSTR